MTRPEMVPDRTGLYLAVMVLVIAAFLAGIAVAAMPDGTTTPTTYRTGSGDDVEVTP